MMLPASGVNPAPDRFGPERPARVLVTIHRISLGGADRVAMMLCSALVAAGHATALLVLRDGGEGEESLLKLLDGRVEVLRAGPALGSRHLELVRGWRFIRRQIARWRPDIVLASSNNMGLVTGLASYGLRPPLLLKFTNPVLRPQDRGALRTIYRKRLWRFVLGRFDRVLTLSEPERTALAGLYPNLADRLRTVTNPYVSDRMLTSERERCPPSSPKRIVASARLMPQKRIDRLIEVFARVRFRDAELIVLGDGPLRPAIERQIETLGICDRVRLVGFVEDVIPWLERADAFALSSDFEGLPAAVLEALACGLPVVTTDCFDAAQSLLTGQPGCAVVGRDDIDGFARALEAALQAPPKPESLRAIARDYGIEASLTEHVRAIADALGDPPRH